MHREFEFSTQMHVVLKEEETPLLNTDSLLDSFM